MEVTQKRAMKHRPGFFLVSFHTTDRKKVMDMGPWLEQRKLLNRAHFKAREATVDVVCTEQDELLIQLTWG